jgi:hypothetical protein
MNKNDVRLIHQRAQHQPLDREGEHEHHPDGDRSARNAASRPAARPIRAAAYRRPIK